jgi:pulcherriminic acid synthase
MTSAAPDTAQTLPDMLSPEFAADPYPVYHAWHERYPLLWHEQRNAWIVSRYDDVRIALMSDDFSTEPYWEMNGVMHGRSVNNMGGREHAKTRALVQPALRGKDFEGRTKPIIKKFAAERIAAFAGGGRADLVEHLCQPLPLLVIRGILGLPDEDHDFFKRVYVDKHDYFYNFHNDPEITRRAFQAVEDFEAYMYRLIGERRARPRPDLVSELARAEVDGQQLSDEDIKSFCSLLLAGGAETTASTMASMLMNLLLNPAQLAAVRADRSLIPRAFAEAVRFAVPNQIVPRKALKDVELSGGTVRAGDDLMVFHGAANRDATKFDRPDEYDLFRAELAGDKDFSNASFHLAFGRGRHFCVGAILARHEAEIATNVLLDALPDLRLAPGHRPREGGHFSRGPAELLVEFG